MTTSKNLSLLGEGGEHEVYELDEKRVIKKLKGSPEHAVNWLKSNAATFETIQKHLGRFVPQTSYYEALSGEEIPQELEGLPGVIQERINGRELALVSADELEDPNFLQEIIDCMEAVLQLRTESRELLLDWMGTAPEASNFPRIHPLASSNVLVTEEGEQKSLKIIDTNPVNDRIIPIQQEDGTMQFKRANMLSAILSLGWFLKNDSVKNYLLFVKSVARLKMNRQIYNLYYKTIFKLTIGKFKMKLKKISVARDEQAKKNSEVQS